MSVADWSEEDFERDRKQCERINDLEQLVSDMWHGMCGYGHDCRLCIHWRGDTCEFKKRMDELGVEP